MQQQQHAVEKLYTARESDVTAEPACTRRVIVSIVLRASLAPTVILSLSAYLYIYEHISTKQAIETRRVNGAVLDARV